MRVSEALIEQSDDWAHSARDIALIPQLGIVCCFISKNASSFLKTYLSCLGAGKPLTRPRRNPHMPSNTGFQGAEQLGHQKMSDILLDPSVPKIILGRHPVSRLRSAFVSRVRTWQREIYDSHNRTDWGPLRQRIVGHLQKRHSAEPLEALATPVHWGDLVDYVCHTPSGQLDRHLVPQTYFGSTELISYDLVGTVEKLDDFLDGISVLTGKQRLPVGSARLNQSPSQSEHPLSVSKTQQEALQVRYRADYTFFGYRT